MTVMLQPDERKTPLYRYETLITAELRIKIRFLCYVHHCLAPT